ncbi:hypothetical protein, partial [Acinetobacter baumannii]|uniref:hypothetical protein n=1 Tax=Acinetobacter baumannii TaxID=470 RepID=UPI0034D411C1
MRKRLAVYLTGKALEYFMSLKDNISTYSELKEQMSKCFGKLEDANISSAQLSSIAQEKDESFVQFGQRIRQ